eukprot:TRINITY_DN47883_c0_g1_i1.p1 TRINITY_DN47883_c0_g1~~TRINITY_DN47883_c0_g1_i1.p1  ORF type:complete len:457 (+),score=103.13 TRINITY_DN47883_c0_g1_i1:88-1458(+)
MPAQHPAVPAPPPATGRGPPRPDGAGLRSEAGTPGLSEAPSEASREHTPAPPPPGGPPTPQPPTPQPAPPSVDQRPASAPPNQVDSVGESSFAPDSFPNSAMVPRPPSAPVGIRRTSSPGAGPAAAPRRRVSLFSEDSAEPAQRFSDEAGAAAAIQGNWRRNSAAVQQKQQKRNSSAALIQNTWRCRGGHRGDQTLTRSQSHSYHKRARPVMVDEASEFGRAYAMARRSSVMLEEFIPDARKHLGVTAAAEFGVAATTAIRVRRASAKLLAITRRASLAEPDFGRRASMRLLEQAADEPWWRSRHERSNEERNRRLLRITDVPLAAPEEEEGQSSAPLGLAHPCPGLPTARPVSSPNYRELLTAQLDEMEHLRENDCKYRQMMDHFQNITRAAHERLDRIIQVIDAWEPRIEMGPGVPRWWDGAAARPEQPTAVPSPVPPPDPAPPEEARRPHTAR